MNDFFQTLHRAMRDKENLRIEITREGDRMKVMVQPLLGEEPDNVDHDEPNDATQIRAALALPLSLHMDPKNLDVQFGQSVQLYGDARVPLHDSFEVLLDALNEAAKAAKIAVSKTKAAPASPPKPVSKNKAVPEAGKVDVEGDGGSEADASTITPATRTTEPVQQTIL